MSASRIAIYGANGYTGRLVATELLARGQDIVLAGRNADALDTMAEGLASPAHVTTSVAALDNAGALRDLAENATVLIHCAGPFAVTGPPVASAAAAAGCHYVDHAVEPHHVRYLFDQLQEPAHRSGAIMIPQTSFYGGIPDLLAAATTDGMTDIDRVTIGYSVSGWRLTPAAKRTAELLITEIDRITFADGAHHVGPVEVRNTVFPFPPPLGPRTMIAPFPMGEIVTIPRHVSARTVEAQLTSTTFEDEQVFTSEQVDDATRAQSTFTIAVQATGLSGGGRTGHLSGRDLWRAGVLLSVEAALRLAGGQCPAEGGVFSTAEAFRATPMLADLDTLGAFAFHGVIESAAKTGTR
ncbi:MAG TPA: saccharopine dehydrogenase NADP-binding domain-containing protein [Streptosporangiaceae bacterium]